MAVSVALPDIAGASQEIKEGVRDHWAITADDVTFDAGNGKIILTIDADDWTAIPGDADVNGTVELADLSTLAFYWEQSSGMSWLTGDFDCNGTVELADLSALAFHWEETEAGAPAVPEPLTLGLLALSGVAVLRRRRR